MKLLFSTLKTGVQMITNLNKQFFHELFLLFTHIFRFSFWFLHKLRFLIPSERLCCYARLCVCMFMMQEKYNRVICFYNPILYIITTHTFKFNLHSHRKVVHLILVIF